ncbi:MAG: monovalent cation/H(+) antiporter subunit G [Planctomycetes bacterium]|nr:monovalent cation/H(+) antiporter subunit G [Planctomycetota bacterium]
MQLLSDIVAVVFLLGGLYFFLAGTVGLLRFPDLFTRLHALTKADTLGVGMIVVGVAVQVGSWSVAVKLALVWFLVIAGSATSCQLVANAALRALKGSGERVE